jgi:hypothetical protein
LEGIHLPSFRFSWLSSRFFCFWIVTNRVEIAR